MQVEQYRRSARGRLALTAWPCFLAAALLTVGAAEPPRARVHEPGTVPPKAIGRASPQRLVLIDRSLTLLKVDAELVTDNVGRDASRDFWYKEETRSDHFYPRLTLVATRKEGLQSLTMAVTYYSRAADSGSMVKEQAVELITIPSVPPMKNVVVDPAGIVLSRYEFRDRGYIYDGQRKAGQKFHGFVVVVFDADEKLVYSGASSDSLKAYVPTQLPKARPQEEKAKDVRSLPRVGP